MERAPSDLSAHSGSLTTFADGDGRCRYEVQRILGEGGSGRVYAAYDTQLDRHVALKTLKVGEPDDVYRLKREFRSLLDIVHPNLVHLYELVVRDRHAYFTMELVTGSEFLQWVWGNPSGPSSAQTDAQQLSRLRSGFAQLACALHTLHLNGRLHRDVKPGNVMVTPDGRVVLVDLGLAVDLSWRSSNASMEGQVSGTFQYMSPEQARAQVLTPASDWYSFGLMLYEAFTGSLPTPALALQQFLPTRSARSLRPQGAPDDLANLAERLLADVPAARPAPAEILRVLPTSTVSPVRVPAQLHRTPLVGRTSELALLHSGVTNRSASGASILCVSGDPGLGKTALIEAFLNQLECEGALVLRSRCHYREKIAYKALDGIVDDLSRYLVLCTDSELAEFVPVRVQELLDTFPTLRRVPILGDIEHHSSNEPTASIRHVAFLALRGLLQNIAAVRKVILWVDDLQWVDQDSLFALQALAVSRAFPGYSIVLSFRSAELNPSLRVLEMFREGPVGDRTEVRLARLPDDDMYRLAEELLPASPDDQIRGVVAAACGSPLVARELCRDLLTREYQPTQHVEKGDALLEALVIAKTQGLPGEARTLFGLICIAGFPINEQLVAAFEQSGKARFSINLLLNRGLVRYVVSRGSTLLDVAHDRLRDVFLTRTGASELEAIRYLLGRLMNDVAGTDPFQRIEYLVKSGCEDDATQVALAAAQAARGRAAFDLAAALFNRCISLTKNKPTWQLRTQLGEVLCESGRVHDGIQELVLAADGITSEDPDSLRAIRIRAVAGERLMTRGHYLEGMQVMSKALDAIGLQYAGTAARALLWTIVQAPRVAMAKWIWRLTRCFRLRATTVPEGVHLCLEVIWSAGAAIAQAEPVHGIQFHARHALLAYGSGQTEHIALSLCVDAVVLSMRGGARRWAKSEAIRTEAERLATMSNSTYAKGFLAAQTAAQYYFMGRWRDAAEQAEQAEHTCMQHRLGMASQLGLTRFLALTSRTYEGRLALVRSRTPDVLIETDGVGDTNSMTCLRVGWINFATWLCSDDAESAQHHLERAEKLLDPKKFTSLNYLCLVALANWSLYAGDPIVAYQRIKELWPSIKRSFQLALTVPHYELFDVRARTALAAAHVASNTEHRTALLADARRSIAALSRSALPFANAGACALTASLLELTGEPEMAKQELQRAVLGYKSTGMDLHSAACSLVLHERLGCGAHDEISPNADAWFRTQEVVCPERVAWVVAPVGSAPDRRHQRAPIVSQAFRTHRGRRAALPAVPSDTLT